MALDYKISAFDTFNFTSYMPVFCMKYIGIITNLNISH